MPDNDLVNTPGPPLPPWAPKQPVAHQRLNDMQAKPVYEVVVRGAGARAVRNGTTVCILLQDAGGSGTQVIVAHITGEKTGGGTYSGVKVTKPTTTFDPSVGVTPETIGEDGTDEITLLNLQENNSDSHWLTHVDNADQLYCLAIPWGTDTDGKTVYAMTHVWVNPCEGGGGGTDGEDGHSISVYQQSGDPGGEDGDVWLVET
jgi:hypothetical protein